MDYCLPARATTPSPLPRVDEASGSKDYSAMPVLTYGLLGPDRTAPVHRIPSSTPELLLFCMTHEVFPAPALLSAPERGSSAFDSLPLSSLPQRPCCGCFGISQRPLTIINLISIVKNLPPVDRSVLPASLCLYLDPRFRHLM